MILWLRLLWLHDLHLTLSVQVHVLDVLLLRNLRHHRLLLLHHHLSLGLNEHELSVGSDLSIANLLLRLLLWLLRVGWLLRLVVLNLLRLRLLLHILHLGVLLVLHLHRLLIVLVLSSSNGLLDLHVPNLAIR